MKIKTIDDIISTSGDSELIDYHFSDHNLDIELKSTETDNLIHLKVNTNNNILDKYKFRHTCLIRLVPLASTLKIENNFYMPPNNFNYGDSLLNTLNY